MAAWPGPPPVLVTDASERYDAFAACDAAVAVSGTVATELAAARLPSVVAYRASWLTEMAARHLALVSHVSLPNIVLGRQVIPEALFSQCTPERVADLAAVAIADPVERARQIEGMAEASAPSPLKALNPTP